MTARRAGRPLWWAAGLVLVLVLAGAGWALSDGGKSAVLPPPSPRPADDGREDAAAELLDALARGLEGASAADIRTWAADTARSRRELADTAANLRRLDIADLSLRYLDEDEGRRVGGVPPRLRDRAWVADVALTWRLDRHDPGPVRMEVAMAFVQTDEGVRFVSARGPWGSRAPLWLLDRLAVAKSRRTLVMAASGDQEAREYARLARRAVRDVARVLPRWRGSLVVEVPGSQQDLGRVLTSESTYDAIAAVTAPVDGSSEPGAPTHVFVNPGVFEPLGPQGAQIVMSHEATHVATEAAVSGMPTWLLEGFADYVALAHVDLPVEVTASQILAQVRRSGPPRKLPTERDFESESKTLGASYEAAWLACRLIAQQYGERALIEFYRTAEADSGTRAAFREVLGTTKAKLTAQWRAELRRLAG